MIVTVTPNTGIDRTMIVPEFELNKTIRASQCMVGMGGKATDASWILGKMGVPNLALGFAAGDSGKLMVQMLKEHGSHTDFTWVQGETRVNIILIADGEKGQSTFTVSTLEVKPDQIISFFNSYEKALMSASCIIAGGSLPNGVKPSFYKELIYKSRQKNIPVIFDASGPGLLAGLNAGPDLIKPNRVELEEITGQKIEPSLESVYQAALFVKNKYGVIVVATMGSQGALAVLSKASYFIPALPLKVISSAGAGDGVLAGLSVAYSQQKPVEEGLRLGFAIASAVLLTATTADYNPGEIERLLPLIQLIPYP
jgi:tagatose 6-phosphate kinase